MPESTATIKLRAVDTNVVTTINNVSAASTNALLGATALAGGFKLLEKATSTSVAQMAVGANNAQLLTENFGKLANASNKATQAIGKISTAAFYTQQLAIAADGVGRAAEQYARLPQAMQAMQASGVSTYSIQQFNTLTEAIRGSDLALDSLLVSSIAELGEFEKAAARAGTILKSSLRFDDAGNPLTANAEERLANAIQVQNLVNDKLNNTVTSTQALLGQYEVLSSGFTGSKESQEVLEQALKLVSIGQTGGVAVNTTDTLQLVTKTLNAYELSAEDAAKVTAKLNAVVENGLTTIPELSQGFGRMAAQAGKANIALSDSGAAVSVLTAQGTSTAEAMTGIARLSASIISKTPEAEKELAKLQLRGEKIRFDKAEIQAKGFTQALIDLYDAAGGSSEILTKIFPEDVAFRTANALLVENGRRLASTREKIAAADESKLNEIFEVSQSDRTARFLRLANRFKESIIELGIALAPTLEPGIKALETIANKFAGLPEPVRKAIGSYLAFRIQTKAISSAAGELIKTLIGLATNYLTVRLISLALTGQLGKEARAVKQLIVQKKGLAAATLQLFGIDQKWRLEQTAATAAIAQQGKVAQAAAAAKAKAAATVKSGVVAGVAATSGITKEQVVTELGRRKAQAIALLQTGTQKAREYAQQLANRFGFQLPTAIVTPPPARPVAALPPAGGAGGRGVAPTVAPAPTRVPAPPPKPQPTRAALNTLVSRDRAVADAATAYGKVRGDYDKLAAQQRKVADLRSKALIARDKAQVALTEAKNKAIAATTNKQAALNEVNKRAAKLKQANNLLAQRENELRQINTAGMVQRNRLLAAENTLEQARLSAKAKYAPLAKAIALQQKAEAVATKASTAEKIAKLKAEQTEVALGAKHRLTLKAKRDAYLAESTAKKANSVATQAKAVVDQLETKLTEKQLLAEQGLYKARLFGRTVKLSEVGLMGSINKLLTTNIALTNASTVANAGLAKTKAGLAAITSVLNARIGLETVKLGAIKGIRTLESAYLLLKAGVIKATSAISGLLSPLGALTPLLGVGAIALIALRSEFFGLGKDVRKATKDYQQFLKEQEKLNTSIQKRSGLTAIEGLLDGADTDFTATIDVKTEVATDKGVVNQAIVATQDAAKNVAIAPVKVGKFAIDAAGNLIFGKEQAYSTQSNSAITQQLIRLKDSGALTTSEFNRLAIAFDKTSQGGDKAKESLKELRAEIKRVKAGAQEIEKGILSKFFDGVKSIPGLIGGAVDNVFTTMALVGNTVPNLIMGRGFTSFADIKLAREADKLLEPLSILGNLQAEAGDRFFATTEAIIGYKENLVLTSVAQQKVAQGIKLTAADLANEEQAYKARADKNRAVIEQMEAQIKANQDIAAKTKNEENKRRLENQIRATIRQKEALEAQNEALKQLQEDTKEYLQNILPAIQTALKENADPTLALTNAQEKFNNTFLKDGDGNITKMLKPIETLRNEGAKLVGQIQENLAFGLLDEFGGGELKAAEEIRAIRDNQISFMENGELVTGYRFTLGQRRELTTAIIQLENQELKRAETKNQIEIELAKSLQQARLETATATNLKIAELQQKAIAGRIAQKENEIEELRKLGLRTIDAELQLEQLRIQQRSAGFGLATAQLEARLAKERLIAQKRDLDVQRQIADSQRLVAFLNQENTIVSANLKQYQQQLEITNSLAQATGSISQNQVYNAQIQQQSAIARLNNLKQTLPLERSQLQNQIKITQEKNRQQFIEAQNREARAELALTEAREQFNLARKNDVSREQLEQLKLQVEQSQLNLDRAIDATDNAQFQLDIQEELNQITQEQFETSKQLEQSSTQIGISKARLAETEAKITREYQLQSRAIEVRNNQEAIRTKELNSIVSFRSGELNLANQLTNSEKEKLKIARQMAALKLNSLKSQIASEAEVLALNQRQAKLQLKAKQDKTAAELDQNKADLLRIQASVDKLKATGASQDQIEAELATFNAALAQRQALINRSRAEQDEAKLLRQSQAIARDAFSRSSELNIDTARVEAIASLPEKQREQAAKRLAREFKAKAKVSNVSAGQLSSTISGLSNFSINVPELKIPKIELPSLDDIKANLDAIVSEFRSTPPNAGNALNSFEGEGRKFVIQNLSVDSPINISIDGAQDKEAIAQEVEGVVFNTMTDVMRGVEDRLNDGF